MAFLQVNMGYPVTRWIFLHHLFLDCIFLMLDTEVIFANVGI